MTNPTPHLLRIAALIVCLLPTIAPAGSETAPVDRSPAADAHAALSCDRCHLGADRVAVARCAGCHEPTGPARPSAFHRSPDRDCAECHVFHDPGRLRANDRVFEHDFTGGTAALCLACHATVGGPSRLDEAHRAAAAAYHLDAALLADLTPSDACLRCHGRGATDLRVDAGGAPRFETHATHPYGIEVYGSVGAPGYGVRRVIDARLRLFDERMECQTCHDLTDDVDDRLVRIGERRDLCRGCHVRDTERSMLNVAAGD